MAKQDEPNKVIYSMVGVGKVHGGERVLGGVCPSSCDRFENGGIGRNGRAVSAWPRVVAA